LLPFNIGTSSIIEVKSQEMLIFLPISVNQRKNNVYREVYSAKFVYTGKQFDVRYDTLKKRMSMPVDMDARSKVVHVEEQHQIWIMDVGYGLGESAKVF
jgi:hypothetical protein